MGFPGRFGRDATSLASFLRRASVFTVLAAFVAANPAAQTTRTGFDLNGKAVDPFQASGGKLVVLLFVRTDCPISNRYAPAIQKMSTANASSAKFWLVYPDKNESAEKIRAHDREYGYTIGSLRDPDHSLVKLAQATITPEAAVFTSDGRLVYHGRIDDWYVEMGRSRTAPTTHELNDAIQAAAKNPDARQPTVPSVGCYISDLS